MMELLSPAGSMDCLVAAVQNGADAVYFGGSILNARRFADNFAGENLVKALDYCHERNVRAYITLNTLVFDRELSSALQFAEQLHRFGADAVLVQDLGLASILRKELPGLILHASTQMGIHDVGGAKYCESIGMKRAVLAREVSLEQIKHISDRTNIELEAFGHGALCMSFSGSCLYSSMSGERSGNRGTCAQPCRKAASVQGKPGASDFCLSPNDICMIEHLADLEKAGICCIKLEGRMKKPEYVAAVTRSYRAALDGADESELVRLKDYMYRFFNRGDFSTAHVYFDSVRTDRVGSSKPEPSEADAAKASCSLDNRKRKVDMHLRLKPGECAMLDVCCSGYTIHTEGAIVQTAAKHQPDEAYAQRLAKLGDTPFSLNNCDVNTYGDCYISAADLNALRRNACAALTEKYHVRNSKTEVTIPEELKIKSSAAIGKPFVYAVVSNADEAVTAFETGADYVGLDAPWIDDSGYARLDKYRSAGKKLILVLPNVIITKKQNEFIRNLIESGHFDGAEANNIGQVDLISELRIKIAGIGLNALNTFTVSEFLRIGFDYVIPSQELSAAQFKSLADEYSDRIITWIHGRVPLMHLLHCPVKEHKGCRNCKADAGYVTDEAGRKFPLRTVRYPDKCLVRMLNCNTTDLIDIYEKLPQTAGLRLSFAAEMPEAISERLKALKKTATGETINQYPDSTRGHWNRKVD